MSELRELSFELGIAGRPEQLRFRFDLSKGNHRTAFEYMTNGQLYEPDIATFLLRSLRVGDFAIDVGANIGCHTLLMSKLVGATGRVAAFEPDPNNATDLEANISVNQLSNVTQHSVALSNRVEEVNLVCSKEDGGWSFIDTYEISNQASENRVKTSATTIQHLFAWDRIRLIKIDVEGFEGRVIDGALNCLMRDQVDYWIIEYAPHCLSRYGEDQWTIRNRFYSAGLDCFILCRSGFLPLHIPRCTSIITPKELTDRYVINLLFCKPCVLSASYDKVDVARFAYTFN